MPAEQELDSAPGPNVSLCYQVSLQPGNPKLGEILILGPTPIASRCVSCAANIAFV